ncbi:histidine phosphatase family protein [[Clostridium] fimetarium]|uniref:Probable phosphoglycerate mutase n=1 Tax=[Clostridium] fimetarium TaxID=99656 RepID=A0A1I0QUD7_9FIRM|nr:histidine phosphatase family protein [[Clostridium] fimetarium]SEW31023.1 probable phosphoglycerate mutase [[Clostridium] fimetarium]
MKLIFIRHGQTDWNLEKRIQGSTDIELNKNGLDQGKRLGIELKDMHLHIEKIYTSKQKRAEQTAEIVSQYLNKKYEVLEGLEEMNLGLWEGNTWTEVQEKYPAQYSKWLIDRRYTRLPEGESYQDVLDRLLPILKKIIKINSSDVLIVTHSAVIMCLLSYLRDTPFNQMVENYAMKNTEIVEIDSKEFGGIS